MKNNKGTVRVTVLLVYGQKYSIILQLPPPPPPRTILYCIPKQATPQSMILSNSCSNHMPNPLLFY